MDADGNQYNSVIYDNGQEWITENLRTSHYANGDAISYVSNSSTWINGFSSLAPQHCSYDDAVANDSQYGRFYNYHAATDIRNVCADGWRLPTHTDWTALIDQMGGEEVAGGSLKHTSSQFWSNPNEGASNSSGFSAIGAGYRVGPAMAGQFRSIGDMCYLWASNFSTCSGQSGSDYCGFPLYLSHSSEGANLNEDEAFGIGAPIRCIKGTGPVPEFAAISLSLTQNPPGASVALSNFGVAPIAYADFGFALGTSTQPTTPINPSLITHFNDDEISVELTGLQSGQTYFLRPYAINTFGIGYGVEVSFVAP